MSNGSLSKVVLDNGVFRELIKKSTSQEDVQGILDHLNTLVPARLVSTIPLWAEYIGVTRPAFRNPRWPAIEELQSIEQFSDLVASTMDGLVESYKDEEALAPCCLQQTVDTFMATRVTDQIREARELARDILYFEGQSISYEEISNELALFYAADELLFLVRFIPVDLFACLHLMVSDMKATLKEYHHLPIYRFADSIVALLLRTHTEDPDPSQPKAIHTIRTATKGLKQLKPKESADCMYLWSAVQGILTEDGLEQVTVITFDTQSVDRLTILIDTLAAKFYEESLLGHLQQEQLLEPGRVLLLCDKDGSVKEDISITPLLNDTLIKAANW